MADAMELTKNGFTREQADALWKTFGQKAERSFDRSTLMWLIGGLTGLGIFLAGVIWAEIGTAQNELRSEIGTVRDELRSEIGTVRDELRSEIGTVRDELRGEIRENRAAIADLAKGQARIEAILEERLPRDR